MTPTWRERPPAWRLRHGRPEDVAAETIDEAMAATTPGRRWYGRQRTRSVDAFEKYAHAFSRTMKVMTTLEVDAIEEIARRRARSMNIQSARDRADTHLLSRIGKAARIETDRRRNQAVDDIHRLFKLEDPAKIKTTTAEMNDDRLFLADQRANHIGQDPLRPLSIPNQRACNAVHAAMADRHGDLTDSRKKDAEQAAETLLTPPASTREGPAASRTAPEPPHAPRYREQRGRGERPERRIHE